MSPLNILHTYEKENIFIIKEYALILYKSGDIQGAINILDDYIKEKNYYSQDVIGALDYSIINTLSEFYISSNNYTKCIHLFDSLPAKAQSSIEAIIKKTVSELYLMQVKLVFKILEIRKYSKSD